MAIEDYQRKYKMTDSQLCIFTSNLCSTLTRDLDDLSIFGVTEDKISDLRSLGEDFENFVTDEVCLANVIGATEDKNSKIATLKESIRNMGLRVQLKWGAKSHQLKSLGITGMNEMIDDSLFAVANRVHDQMEIFLPDLSDTGLTEDMLEDFEDLIDDCKSAIQIQNDKINERDIKRFDRINKGNELYNEVVKFCDIGKRVYAMNNSAKYDDYLIYGTGTGGSAGGGSNGGGSNQPSAPTNFRYDYADRTVRWDAVSGATSYLLEISDDNTVWDVMYEGGDTEFFTGEMLPDHKYLRIRSRNANGFSTFATYNVVYEYVLNGPTNLTHNPALPGFTWDAVPNATAYEVQLRLASGSDDDYNLIYFGNDTTLIHGDPNGSYYVRARAWSNSGLSGWHLLAYSVGV